MDRVDWTARDSCGLSGRQRGLATSVMGVTARRRSSFYRRQDFTRIILVQYDKARFLVIRDPRDYALPGSRWRVVINDIITEAVFESRSGAVAYAEAVRAGKSQPRFGEGEREPGQP